MVAPKRAVPITVRLKEESYAHYHEIWVNRKRMNMNSNKADILSQALDELYLKEIGTFAPHGPMAEEQRKKVSKIVADKDGK